MSDEPDEETLDEIEHKIEDARHQAEEHGTIPDPKHHERTFIDPDGDGENDGSEDFAP